MALEGDSSYVYGCLEENYSCNHSYFTYYSEFRISDTPGIVECVILFIVFFASISSNLIVIYHGLTKKTLRTVMNCFILNLAVADVTFALTIPFVAIIRATKKWIFGEFLCKAVTCMDLMCSTILIWSLTVIGIDRYRCIVLAPMRPQCKKYQVLIIIAIVWIVPLFLFIPLVMNFQVFDGSLTPNGTSSEEYTVCSMVFQRRETEDHVPPAYGIVIILFNSVVPMAILSYTYFKIFKKLKETPSSRNLRCYSSKMRMSPANFQSVDNIFNTSPLQSPSASPNVGHSSRPLQESVSTSHLPSSSSFKVSSKTPPSRVRLLNRHRDSFHMNFMQRMRQMRHYRAMKLLVITVLVEYLMWLPLRCITIAMLFNVRHHMKKLISSHDFIYCLTVAFANPFANAILFGILNGNFRPYFTFWKKERNGPTMSKLQA